MKYIFYKDLIKMGGAEVFLASFYKHIIKYDINYKICCFDYNESLLDELELKKSDILKIEGNNEFYKILNFKKLIRNNTLIVHSGFIQSYLATIFTNNKYILFLHHPSFNTFKHFQIFSLLFRKFREKVLSDEFAGPILLDMKKKLGLYDYIKINIQACINYLAVRRASKIIVLTEYAKTEKKLFFNKEAIVLPAGIHNDFLNNYNFFQEENYILYFGRVIKEKRVDLIIKSFNKIKNIDTKLYIVGDGDEREILQKKYKNNHNVIFKGYLNFPSLIDVIKKSKFVITMCWSDYNLTVYESIALGKRVIYGQDFNVESFDKKFIDKKVLFYCKPEIESLKAEIEKLLNYKQLEKIDYEFVKEYSWDWYVQNYLKKINYE